MCGFTAWYRMVSRVLPNKSLARRHFQRSSINSGLSARRQSRLGVGSCIPRTERVVVPLCNWLRLLQSLAITLGNGSLVQRGIVVCSAGTGDRQDLMLARIGLAAVPTTEPIKCDEFKDDIRVMYCINTQQVNPRFLRIMDEMAKTIGLTNRFAKSNHLFRQKTEAKQLAPFRVRR